ncbi:MAG: type I secretion system permease/ATPase [Proteobacteria bacterium]|nr:type I secretion system permease/ATPase [Pseudomonadota bacterium]
MAANDQKKLEKDVLDKALEKCKSVFIYVGCFSLATNILVMVLPLYSLQVLDRVLSSGSYSTLIFLTLITCILLIFLGIFSTIRAIVLIKLGEWMDKELHAKFLSTTLTVATLRPGVSGSQSMRDLLTVRQFMTGTGINSMFDAPWGVIFLGVIFMIHWSMGVILSIGAITLLILTMLNEAAMRKPLGDANEKSVRNMGKLDLAMRNAEVIGAMGMEQQLVDRWGADNSEVLKLQNVASTRSAIILSISKTFRSFLQIAIYAFGAYHVLGHEMTVGSVIACSILSSRALAPFETSISTWSTIDSARKAYTRLKETLRLVPERPKGISLPAPKGVLQVDRLVYAPQGATKPILKGVSFNLGAGDTLGIIGPSAAGKSTLAKLLVGIYRPVNGSVRLDSADVYSWDRTQFGKYVGYLPQDVELFAGKVKENIARMQTNVSDESIVQAAQMAEVHDMVLHLAEGYETDIGPAGMGLSAGQRQRVGLARAFYGDPKLVVLDEPNANLDDAGEQALSRAIIAAKAKKITTIVISHRTSVLKHVDYVMVMQDGMVADFGAASDIMAKVTGKLPSPVKQLPKQPTASSPAAKTDAPPAAAAGGKA